MAKILEKSGNFVSPEKWEPCLGVYPPPPERRGDYLGRYASY